MSVIKHRCRRTWVRGTILQVSWLLIVGSVIAHFYGCTGVAIFGGGILLILALLLLVGMISISL